MADDVRLITTVGAGSVVAPAGYNCVVLEAWGGGAGGQVAASQEGGGGGGAYCNLFQPSSAGQTWFYSVGAGGAPGVAGGNSFAADASTYAAAVGGISANGGTTATASDSVSATGTGKGFNLGAWFGFSGGKGKAPQGGSGTRGGSGGGGTGGKAGVAMDGGAGSGSAGGAGGWGNNGTAPQTGTAASGAAGAAGATHVDGGGGGGGGGGGAGTGGAGGVPGGGGGGGGQTGNAGTGARGQVRLTFTNKTIGSLTGMGQQVTASVGTLTASGNPTQLNPSDKKNVNVVLSNSNKTVTGNDPTNNWVRSTNARAGKRYVEFTTTTVANSVIGIADLSALTFPGADAKSFGMFSSSAGSIAGTFPSWGPAYASGNVLGMAVDFTAAKVWYRVNGGAWNAGGSADPATGIGGWDIALYTGDPDYLVVSGDVGCVTTVNFGATAFAATQPSGYLAWDGNPNVSANITGASAPASAGTLTVKGSVAPTITGVQATASVGTLTVNIGVNVSAAITGAQATASAGTLGFKGNVAPALTGVQANASPGTLTFRGNVAPTITGNVATTGVGSLTVSIPGTGRTKVWTGSAWTIKPVKVWTGSAWVQKPAKVWNGTAWV
jgi:hypothetical protein